MTEKYIKTMKLCKTCRWAFRNCLDGKGNKRCSECERKLPNKMICQCLKIQVGDVCPYYIVDEKENSK